MILCLSKLSPFVKVSPQLFTLFNASHKFVWSLVGYKVVCLWLSHVCSRFDPSYSLNGLHFDPFRMLFTISKLQNWPSSCHCGVLLITIEMCWILCTIDLHLLIVVDCLVLWLILSLLKIISVFLLKENGLRFFLVIKLGKFFLNEVIWDHFWNSFTFFTLRFLLIVLNIEIFCICGPLNLQNLILFTYTFNLHTLLYFNFLFLSYGWFYCVCGVLLRLNLMINFFFVGKSDFFGFLQICWLLANIVLLLLAFHRISKFY